MAAIQIGQLLVEQGTLSALQVRHILQVQKLSHRPFGDLAERLYGIDPRAIEDAWVEQYLRVAGLVDLNGVEPDSACLRALSRRQAWQFYLLPIRRAGDALQVATTPDHLVRSVNFVARKLGEPVHFILASRRQLRTFLMAHYPVPEHLAQYAAQL